MRLIENGNSSLIIISHHHLFYDVLSMIKVTNISPSAQDSDLSDFFSTAGDISKLVVKDGLNNTKRATIDFKEKRQSPRRCC